MRFLSIIIFAVFIFLPVLAQKKSHHSNDTARTLHDIFKGSIPNNGWVVNTTLQLDHKLFADMGGFLLLETYKTRGNKDSIVPAMGEWTVLKGDANDDNATVVELDAAGGRIYFLRKKDGSLQKLDTSLHEISPAKNYVLKKE